MKDNFRSSLDHVLVHEGGWADHPKDPGGATMKGVTLAVFQRHFGAKKTKDDLRNISDAELEKVYRTGYWDKCSCDDLPLGVDYAVFDSAVNSGPGRGAKWLQQAVGAIVDGGIGPNTLESVALHEPQAIINSMLDARMRFLRGLRTFSDFGRGWTRRVSGVRAKAIEMAGAEVPAGAGGAEPDVKFEVLKKGSKGEWVERVQKALHIHVDGDFGPQTEAAVMAFQEANGLTRDGIVGRDTYRALGLVA